MISKSLVSNLIIVGLAVLAACYTEDACLVFLSIFFLLLMIELKCIKNMIKNIPPWY